jgi:hypothetical protein
MKAASALPAITCFGDVALTVLGYIHIPIDGLA